MPLIGAFHFVFNRKINKLVIPLIAIFIYSLIQSLVMKDLNAMARSVQGILMVFFSQFLAEYFKENEIINLIRSSLIFSVLYYLLEYLLIPNLPLKEVVSGLTLVRFSGIVGESNFSALLLFGMGAFSLYFKRLGLFALSFLLVLPLMSRMGILLFVLILVLYFINSFIKIHVKKISYLSLSIILLSPMIMGLLDSFLSEESCLLMSKITNGRFAIASGYWKMFLDHPFGVGYYNGPELILKYLPVKYNLGQFDFHHHSLYVQTLSEFGIIGHLLLGYFFYQLISTACKRDTFFALMWIVLLFGMSSLNSYSEFVFYLFIAWTLDSKEMISFKLSGGNSSPN